MKKSLIMLILLVVAIASGQRAEAQCPTGYQAGANTVRYEFCEDCYVEVTYCVEIVLHAEILAGKIPSIHILDFEWVNVNGACELCGLPVGADGFAPIPWAGIVGKIMTEEVMQHFPVEYNVPPCDPPSTQPATIEVTHGGCYYYTYVQNGLEYRKIANACNPGNIEKCHQYWYLCKDWDPILGNVVTATAGPLEATFDCEVGPAGQDCQSICE
jgi:hypothetical protein